MPKKLRGFYARGVSVELGKKLEELNESGEERADLSQEVDMARLLALDALKVYDTVSLKEDASPKAKGIASTMLRDAINNVAALVTTMTKVDVINGSAIPMEHVNKIIYEVTRIIEEEVAEVDKDRADRIIERIRGMSVGRQLEKPSVTISID